MPNGKPVVTPQYSMNHDAIKIIAAVITTERRSADLTRIMKVIRASSPKKIVVVHKYSLPNVVNMIIKPTGNITIKIPVRIFKILPAAGLFS